MCLCKVSRPPTAPLQPDLLVILIAVTDLLVILIAVTDLLVILIAVRDFVSDTDSG